MHAGVVRFDITSGATALTDISSGIVRASVAFSKNIGTHHTIGSDWAQATVGGKGATATVDARVDQTATTSYQYLMSAALATSEAERRTMEFYVPDNTTGSVRVSGEVVVGAPSNVVNMQGGSGDVSVASFPVTFDGTVTFDAVA
jgi:hypothetical protein